MLALGQLSETLSHIRTSMQLDGQRQRHQWLQILGVTEKQYSRFERGQATLPDTAVERLAQHLGLAPERILLGQIDFRGIAIRFSHNQDLIPQHYTVATFGRQRATAISLDYVEKRLGWRARANALSDLGISEAYFSNYMAPISMKVITDLCAFLARTDQMDHSGFRQMGMHSVEGNKNTILHQVFSACKDPKEIYLRMFGDMLKFYEQNCSYEIVSLTSTRCVVDVRSNPYIALAMGVRHLGNPHICDFKAGWIASATGYLGLPFADITESRCVHRGDPACRYEIDYSLAAKLHGSRSQEPAPRGLTCSPTPTAAFEMSAGYRH